MRLMVFWSLNVSALECWDHLMVFLLFLLYFLLLSFHAIHGFLALEVEFTCSTRMWGKCFRDGFCRYFQGSMMKSEQGIHGSEQMLSSDGSTLRGGGGGVPGGQDSSSSQMLSNLSRLPSMNQSWHSAMTSKVGQAPGDSAKVQNNSNNSSSSLLHYHSPQMRGLLGQDFGLLPETSQVDHVTHGMSQQHQQHQQHQQQAYHVSNAYGGGGHGAESVSHVGRESEGQPLRHFFDDWPRASRDQSAMTWGSSGVDESERSNSDNNNNNLTINTHHGAPNNNNNNNTQLSISIPITASSSAALSAQHSGSPPAGTFSIPHFAAAPSRPMFHDLKK
jgi:hypothetical protein